MPPGFTLEAGYPRATACGGSASGIQWRYLGPGAYGTPANVSVLRGVTKYVTADVPAKNVSTVRVGTREAILIRPTTSDGFVQISQVVFPEGFGTTVVYAFNLSEESLLQVASAVEEATR